jgi:hypothetical protein
MISNENNKNNLFRVKSKNGVLRCLKAGVDINICNEKVKLLFLPVMYLKLYRQ